MLSGYNLLRKGYLECNFDTNGKLWVANFGNGSLVSYSAAQQITGGPDHYG